MSHRKSDLELEQQIFLGGQVSDKYKEFMTIAKMSPDYAEMYLLLEKWDEIEKEPDDQKAILKIIEILGEVDFMRYTTELTRLSMILGETRKHYDMGKI